MSLIAGIVGLNDTLASTVKPRDSTPTNQAFNFLFLEAVLYFVVICKH